MTSSSISETERTRRSNTRSRRWKFALAVAFVLSTAGFAAGLSLFFRQGNPPVNQPSLGPPRHTLVPEDVNRERFANGRLFSPDGKFLIVFRSSPIRGHVLLTIWDMAKKEEVHSIDLPRGVPSVSMSARGDLLAVAIGGPLDEGAKASKDDGKPREVRLYSFPDMKEVGKIESERYISSAVLSPDGKLLATARQNDKTSMWDVAVWDVATRKPKYTLHTFAGVMIHFSPDSKKLAHTNYVIPSSKDPRSGQDAIGVFDVDSGKPLQVICHGRSGMPLNFQYFPDGQEILVKSSNVLRAYDAGTGRFREIYRHGTPENGVRHAVISSDAKWLVLGHDDRDRGGGSGQKKTPYVTIWDLQANKVHIQWPVPEIGKYMGSIALSPDKKTLAVSGSGLHLYDLSGK